MKEVRYIRHSEVTEQILDQIISAKSLAWPYSYSEQKKWISEHISDNDIHVILFSNGKILSYLNIIEISFRLDFTLIEGYGIGNFCATEHGMGWGKDLLHAVNRFIQEENRIALLFCRNELVEFYSRNGWFLVEEDFLCIDKLNGKANCMINKEGKFTSLTYDGKVF